MKVGDKVIVNEGDSQVRWYRKNIPDDKGVIEAGRVVTIKAQFVTQIVTVELEEIPGQRFLASAFKVVE